MSLEHTGKSKKQMVIVGLGLIGGSLAMALEGFEDYELIGVARSNQTRDFAIQHHICNRITQNVNDVLPDADVVWLCQHPDAIIQFLHDHASDFKPGALVTDVCGIKTAVMEAAGVLPDCVDFIGCHPMAGKETSGIQNAEKSLFQNAHFILTPRPESTPAHIALMERMGQYMGFRDAVKTTPQEHDALIAYTSQVMHVMAVAVCDDPGLFACKGFEGGSFRDCTRVAALDVPMWTELFSLNASALCRTIETLESNLRSYREAIQSGDRSALAQKLSHSANRKRQMNLE